MSIVDEIEQRAERGRHQGPDKVWHAAVANAGEGAFAPRDTSVSQRSAFRLVVAGCAIAILALSAVVVAGREARAPSPPARTNEDETTNRLLLDQGQALVVIEGFEMVEAFMTAAPAQVAGIDEWQAFVKPGGATQGFAMIGTTAQSGLELRLSSVTRDEVAEFLELDEDDRWSLSGNAGFDGPFRFQLGLRSDIDEPTAPRFSFAFTDQENAATSEVSLTVIAGQTWPLLHSVVSGQEWSSEDPPSWEPIKILGVDAIGTETDLGSFIVWSDDDWSYLLRSRRTDGSAPIPSDALAELAATASRQEWAAAVEAAAPDYGQPWTDLALRTGTIAAGAAIVAAAAALVRRRHRAATAQSRVS